MKTTLFWETAPGANATALLFPGGGGGFGQVVDGRATGGNILLCGVVALLALFMDVTTSVSFINFGAFLAFTSVNLAVIARFYVRRQDPAPNQFFKYLLIPALGAVADLWLLVSLDPHALYLGLGWLVAGTVYLAVLTRGFRNEPPEMDFSDAA